jgi:hypothetical protein
LFVFTALACVRTIIYLLRCCSLNLQNITAQQHARRRVLTCSLAGWHRYVAHRNHKAAQQQLAMQHHDRALLAHALKALQLRVRHVTGKRRREFDAALHRRWWLIWRAFKAWR